MGSLPILGLDDEVGEVRGVVREGEYVRQFYYVRVLQLLQNAYFSENPFGVHIVLEQSLHYFDSHQVS